MSINIARYTRRVIEYVRRVNPFCWYLCGWFFFVYNNSWPSLPNIGLIVIYTILMIIHLSIYCLLLSVKVRKNIVVSAIALQVALIVVITVITRHNSVVTGLPLALIVFLFTRFKQIYIGIAVLIACLVFPIMPLYLKLLGLWMSGNFQTAYSAYTDGIVTFVLLGVVLYLQQSKSHQRTQELLTELNVAHAQLQGAHDQLAAFALRVEDLTMQNERQRLARELHDTLSQGLAGLVMQLDAANSYYARGQGEKAQAVIQQTMKRARTMLTETRYVIDDLRTEKAPRPDDLPDLVQEEIDRFMTTTGIACAVDLDGLAKTPAQHCAQVIRVITESLANVARHAQATQVWLEVMLGDETLEIAVRDNGVGFDPVQATSKPGHYGLVGLHERARLVGGQLAIESSSGRGTCIRLRIPGVTETKPVGMLA